MRCTVTHCGRNQAAENNPLLLLCGRHLSALERYCKGKHRLAGLRLAQRELARLAAAGIDRSTDQVAARAYRCDLCSSWHTGHTVAGSTSEQDAIAAARALRTNLTAQQFAELLESWRPSRAPRRRIHRKRNPE